MPWAPDDPAPTDAPESLAADAPADVLAPVGAGASRVAMLSPAAAVPLRPAPVVRSAVDIITAPARAIAPSRILLLEFIEGLL
jgi:hypothetical protein